MFSLEPFANIDVLEQVGKLATKVYRQPKNLLANVCQSYDLSMHNFRSHLISIPIW